MTASKEYDFNILDYLYGSMRKDYHLSLPDGFFETYLNKGKALLMFDGLDEVAAEARRAEVRKMISTFTGGYNKGNQVIVTSRIAGYSRARFSTSDYCHYTLEDFDDDEMESFIKKWYNSRLANPAEAKKKAAGLSNILKKKKYIKELARNPLLLTIIGIIHRYEADLPEDRLHLYKKATEALLYTWDKDKMILDKTFKPSHKLRFLEKTAIFLQSKEKGDEAGTVIGRDDLYRILQDEFCNVFKCEKFEAEEFVDQFLETIRLRAGVLVEEDDFVKEQIDDFFRFSWNDGNNRGGSQGWQRFLVWTEGVSDSLSLSILLEKFLPIVEDERQDDSLRSTCAFVLGNMGIEDRGAAKRLLLLAEDEKQDVYLRTACVTALGDMGFKDKGVEILLLLAEDEKQDDYFRCDWATALGNMGFKDKGVEILLLLAKEEQGDIHRLACASALGELGEKEKAIDILSQLYLEKTEEEPDEQEAHWIYDALWELTS
ncbi:MAG: hypothetical protein GY757_61560 [bacterium]|nr:hypothetical protein [bacterium]